MLRSDDIYINALKNVLKKAAYSFSMMQLHGTGAFQDPWGDFAGMKKALEEGCYGCPAALSLLHLGIPADEKQLEKEVGKENIQDLLSSGLWFRLPDGRIGTDNYTVIMYQSLYLVVDINPSFPSCTRPMTDVYIGSDSLRLAENVVWDRDAEILDLCSGSGIQGLLAARSGGRVVCVELNEKALPVIKFNAALNGLADRMEIRAGNLYDALQEGETFDYIYANPPFLPLPDHVKYPMCGAGGRDGLKVLKEIVRGLASHLKPDGEAYIFCESLGNEKMVFFDSFLNDRARENGLTAEECRYNRISTEDQLKSMVWLAEGFDRDLDREAFINEMRGIYRDLGAEYLYSLLYRISRTGEKDENAGGSTSFSGEGNRTDQAERAGIRCIFDHCPPEDSELDLELAESILRKMLEAGKQKG